MSVTRGYLPLLLALAAIWGASFMFIELALEDLAPTTLMAARIVISAVCLVGAIVAMRGVGGAVHELRGAGLGAYGLGVINSAIPFTLIAWGQEHVDSGTAAISNASTPIWVAVLATWFLHSERASGGRLLGILLGLLGVGVLAGATPEASWWTLAGTGAVVAASFCYAGSSLIAQGRMASTTPLTLSAATMIGAAVVLAPVGILQAPSSAPDAATIGSVVALGVAGTAIGLVMFFRIVVRYGSARAALVTYLVPVTAVLYGAGFLQEPIGIAKIGGMTLVLAGVALGSGVVRLPRRAVAVAAPRA
ncbi:MAG: DMT family transporter [Thermoleophilia bacterium]|nr:DMT family transporter [Thermoleophilia bacterium]